MKKLWDGLHNALRFVTLLTLVCGVVYPMVMTVMAQTLFPFQANGSLIEQEGRVVGSRLLAQPFSKEEYFWGRLSQVDYDTFQSEEGTPYYYAQPSNLDPNSLAFKDQIATRIALLKQTHPDQAKTPIPLDLVTGSGSGLDPHISVAAALYQVERVASKRKLHSSEVEALVKEYTTERLFGIFGEPVVNVLELNLALDGIQP
ncbi:MAG: potassium-transporting ATPase subunit KdpC [Erysipelotrichaceae bacterium]